MPPMPAKSSKMVEPVTEPFEEPEDSYIEETQPPIFEDEFITFKRSHFYSALSVLTFFAGILVGYIVWGTGLLQGRGLSSGTASQANGPVVEAPVTAEPRFVRYDVPSEGFHSIGPEDAPITIVEFSDYQCPFCRRWHDEVYNDLMAAYPGQIKLVYRNLPITSSHPDAQSAAEAAMCAGEQDAYWPYHGKLFSSDILGTAVYMQYAEELNLNVASFEACITERRYQQAIQSDSDFAMDLGVSSTPTFFINGLAIVGAQPLQVFQQVIDKELAGEIPQ